jgi:hypothetical protein
VATAAAPGTDAPHPQRKAIDDFEHLSTTSSCTCRIAASRQTSARFHDYRIVSRALQYDTPCVRENFPYL